VCDVKEIVLMSIFVSIVGQSNQCDSKRLDVKRLMKTFALIESSNNPNAIGDGGKAYGLYQFHLARWLECGGTKENWRRATRTEQDKIMRTALTRYLARTSDLTKIANYHNMGNPSSKVTLYTRKFRRIYNEKD